MLQAHNVFVEGGAPEDLRYDRISRINSFWHEMRRRP
jgi:hypothetical protein